MPFVSGRPLDSYFHERAVDRAVRAIADAAGDALQDAVKRHTPVGPPGRKRRPGTLRDSIQRSPVAPRVGIAARGYGVKVFTFDPIAEHVEYPTDPHNIPNAFGLGEDFGIGGPFAGNFHPGTQGAHMFSLGTAETEARVDAIAAPAMAVFAAEVVR